MTRHSELRIEKAAETDAGVVLALIKELADYERMSDEVVATEGLAGREDPATGGDLVVAAEASGDAVGIGGDLFVAGIGVMAVVGTTAQGTVRNRTLSSSATRIVMPLSVSRNLTRFSSVRETS